jgi:hypothetical protein
LDIAPPKKIGAGFIKVPSSNLYLKVSLLLIPVSLAWLYFGWAVTQDGPAHLASARIANNWLAGEPNASAFYRLDLRPLPNWGGQALAMIALKLLPDVWANRFMNLAGLWLPAMALIWLLSSVHLKMQNLKTSWGLALWISLVSMNVVWTFGFTAFLISLAMAWVVLGRVWSYGNGDSKGVWSWFLMASCWWILFLCHLVGYGIAGLVCGCLVLATPGWTLRKRAEIIGATSASLPLVWNYRRMTGGSSLELIWEHFEWSKFFQVSNWVRQIGWIDPISLTSKKWLPILETERTWAILFQPLLWIALAILVWFFSALKEVPKREARSERGWWLAILLLLILGVLGPDSLGKDQGHYLPQRILLGAMSITCVIWPQRIKKETSAITVMLAVAWLAQSVSAIELGRKSESLTLSISGAYAFISQGDRILALSDATAWAYRANPRLHLDSLLVMSAGDLASWNLYEAAHGYFPLQFREKVSGLEPKRLEDFSLMQSADQSMEREAMALAIVKSAEQNSDLLIFIADQNSPIRKFMEASEPFKLKWRLLGESTGWAIYRRN